jgi:xylose isomerase
LVESLEFVYWLRRLNYKGWLTLDIFPYREDGVRAATQCRNWIQALFHAVDRIGLESFAEAIRRGDACDAIDCVRRALVAG